MATKSILTRPEIISSLKQILDSLQHDAENDDLNLVNILSEALYESLLWPKGRYERTAVQQWCKKLQTIAPVEESTSTEHHPTPDHTTQHAAFSTHHSPNIERNPTPDATTDQHNTSSEDASPTQNTSEIEKSPTADTADQHNASLDDVSSKQITSKKNPLDRITDNMISSLIEIFLTNTKTFKSWTENPLLFFNELGKSLQLPELTLKQRLKSFIQNATEQTLRINIQNLILRLDSIIAYLRYQRLFPSQNLTRCKVKPFLEYLELPTGPKEQSECLDLLYSGRRRLEFCYALSKDNTDIQCYRFDDIRFGDIDYGVLFLELDDKIWTVRNGWAYNLVQKIVKALKSQDVITKSENAGAKVAAQALLQYRQAFIQKSSASHDNAENNSMAASNCSSAEVESDSTEMSNDSSAESNSDSTVASNCSSNEAGSDTTEASKHWSKKRVHADSDPDDTRTSKRARTVSDLDSTRASEPVSSDVEEDSSMAASERAHEGEANIANPTSTLYTMQPNNQPSPAPKVLKQFPYPLDIQESSFGVMGAFSDKLLPESVEDYFDTMYTMDNFHSLIDPFAQYLPEAPLSR